MPYTIPSVATVASVWIVLPPPQPMSSMVNVFSSWTWLNPQFVSRAWRTFMLRAMSRPSHHDGLRSWLKRMAVAPPPRAMAMSLRASSWSIQVDSGVMDTPYLRGRLQVSAPGSRVDERRAEEICYGDGDHGSALHDRRPRQFPGRRESVRAVGRGAARDTWGQSRPPGNRESDTSSTQ